MDDNRVANVEQTNQSYSRNKSGAMKIIQILLSVFALGSAYDRQITRQDYGDCEHVIGVTNSSVSNLNFTRYFEISKVKYNYKNSDELLRTRMFFRGKFEFEALLSERKTPASTDRAFPSRKY